jgi:ribosomal-protein-alanine N-acetyltransferase
MTPQTLETDRLILRTPMSADAIDYAQYQSRNREFFAPWSPTRAPSYFDPAWWRQSLNELETSMTSGAVLAFGLYLQSSSGQLVGTCKLDQVARGAFQSAMLGYGLDAAIEGKGYMTEALTCLMAHAFNVMKLHRIQANHLPENVRSAATLARLGFEPEGLARRYLFINGAWRDHVLNALINQHFDETWLQ